MYTGCFANTSLGLKIIDCGSCFCELRNQSAGSGVGVKHVKGGQERPRICMERSVHPAMVNGGRWVFRILRRIKLT